MKSMRWMGALAVAAAVLGSGCAGQRETTAALPGDQAFVPVVRSVSASDADARKQLLAKGGMTALDQVQPGQDFYIAINKRELGQKWFLTAFLEQLFPGGPGAGAASTLGTRVVSFKVQNGKLFVFDVDNRKKSGDVFDPQQVIEAYPVVDMPFDSRYVVFDPAGGMNRFGFVGDVLASGEQPVRFDIDLLFSQNFRALDDGATFEQVFTGYLESNPTQTDATAVEQNGFRLSGTLSFALRRYHEGDGYTAQPLPSDGLAHYFTSDPAMVPHSQDVNVTTIRWAIHPGMKPIKWLISPKVLEAQAQHPEYDLVGAIKAGVENWNQVFGYPVLEAEVADPSVSFGDDDANYIIWDDDPSQGFSRADMRVNPNTGEIRGASVYMSSGFLDEAIDSFASSAAADGMAAASKTKDGKSVKGLARVAHAKVPAIVWGPMRARPVCMLWAKDAARALAARHDASGKTPKQLVEAFLTHVVLHEIGHTLGLRHNFKGSLEPPTSSVMDYTLDPDSAATPVPQAYDVDAIKWLYGLSQTLPAQPFCTDEDVGASDPDCDVFDSGATPLAPWEAGIEASIDDSLAGSESAGLDVSSLDKALDWVRSSDGDVGSPARHAQRLEAWNAVMAKIRPPISAENAKSASYADTADWFSASALSMLFWPDDSRIPIFVTGEYTQLPDMTDESQWWADVTDVVKGILLNIDGVRSFESRDLAVKILKTIQTDAAYQILHDGRATIAASETSMSAADKAQCDELLKRIDLALSPYYQDCTSIFCL